MGAPNTANSLDQFAQAAAADAAEAIDVQGTEIVTETPVEDVTTAEVSTESVAN